MKEGRIADGRERNTAAVLIAVAFEFHPIENVTRQTHAGTSSKAGIPRRRHHREDHCRHARLSRSIS